MASCHKCGKGKIKKRPDGTKRCPKCGFLPGFTPEDVAAKNALAHKSPPNPFGTCFTSAAVILLDNIMDGFNEFTMCHGIGISNYPGQEGQKIAHAWLEVEHPEKGMCAIDPIWLMVQPAKAYRDNLYVSTVVEYTPDEFMALWRQSDYPGPYEPEILKYTIEGKAA